MTGVEIEYLLGILAIIWSTTWLKDVTTIDKFKLIFGIILVVIALFGYALVH